MIHWSWGLSTALILSLVIYLNGKQKRVGWLLGALVQFINMAFGLAYGQWTFAFLAIPATAFVVNWFLHPRRTAAPKPISWHLPQEEAERAARDFLARWTERYGGTGKHRLDVRAAQARVDKAAADLHEAVAEVTRELPPVEKIDMGTIRNAVARDTAKLTGDQRAITEDLNTAWRLS